MRPVYISSKMKPKINKKKVSKRKSKFCGRPGILKSDIEKINKILRNRKLELARGGGSWKVMPKDSCEVYRERRQRQLGRNRQSSERDSDKNYKKTEKKIPKRPSRKGRSNYKPGKGGSQTHGSSSTATDTS
ncbi:uncharacterized protein LOC125074878 isoform X2 [Vanessa atalanta]|uniref:uncharacterized protein LOC125074878 isoform X2 n=1 Tax=Vanessa atalanta TaxID=42275 RepID=UPI001FCE2A92|nr:uncharacterized protein LOC125074878 isoform X2 [Vanessa atalanta]